MKFPVPVISIDECLVAAPKTVRKDGRKSPGYDIKENVYRSTEMAQEETPE